MKLPYQAIFEHAKSDLSVEMILQIIQNYNEEYRANFSNIPRESLENFVIAVYQQWFRELRAKLCSSSSSSSLLFGQRVKDFDDGIGFLPTQTQELRDLVGAAISNEASLTIHPVVDGAMACLTLGIFKQFKSFNEVYQNISTQQIFSNINTPFFNDASKLYEDAFNNFIRATELAQMLKEPGLKDFKKIQEKISIISDASVYTMPLPPSGRTVFHELCEYGSVDLLTLLLGKFNESLNVFKPLTDPTTRPKDWNPKALTAKLIAAIKRGESDNIRLCIDLGANLSYVDTNTQKSILDYACEYSHVETVQELLKQRIPIERSTTELSAFDWALRSSQDETKVLSVIKILVDYCTGFKKQKSIIDSEEDVYKGEDELRTKALQKAVERDFLLVVQFLVESGANQHVLTKEGDNLLHLAAKSKNIKIFTYLLRIGVDVWQKNNNKRTPTEVAPADVQSAINNAVTEWKSGAENKRLVESRISLFLAEDKWSISVDEMQEMQRVKSIIDINTQYTLGRYFYEKKEFEKAKWWFFYAVTDGHIEAQRYFTELQQYIIEKEHLDILTKPEKLSEKNQVGDEIQLQRNLLMISERHPLLGPCEDLSGAVKATEPLFQTTTESLVKLVYWAQIYVGLLNQRKEINSEAREVNQKFKEIKKILQKQKNILDEFDKTFLDGVREDNLLLNNEIQVSAIKVVLLFLKVTATQLIQCYQPKVSTRKSPHAKLVSALREINTFCAEEISKSFYNYHLTLPQPRPLLHSIQTGHCYLTEHAAEKLIPLQGGIVGEHLGGTHPVIPLKGNHYKYIGGNASSSPSPSSPGDAEIVNLSNKSIANQGSAPTTLLKVSRGDISANYLVTPTVQGVTFEHILRYHPEFLAFLDPYMLSARFVMSLLVCPADEKAANEIVEFNKAKDESPHPFSMKVRSIDNDMAFGKALVRKNGKIYTEILSIFYFLKQRDVPLDPAFVEDFLKIDPEKNCIELLSAMAEKNGDYIALLDKKIFTQQEFEGDTNLPPKLPDGYINYRYRVLCLIQQRLREEPNISAMDLFKTAEPILARIYEEIGKEFPDQPLEAYQKLALIVDLKPYITTILREQTTLSCSFSQEDRWKTRRISLADAARDLTACIRLNKLSHAKTASEMLTLLFKNLSTIIDALTLCDGYQLEINDILGPKQLKLHQLTLVGTFNWTAVQFIEVADFFKAAYIILQESNGALPVIESDWSVLLDSIRNLKLKVSLRLGETIISLQFEPKDILQRCVAANVNEDLAFIKFLRTITPACSVSDTSMVSLSSAINFISAASDSSTASSSPVNWRVSVGCVRRATGSKVSFLRGRPSSLDPNAESQALASNTSSTLPSPSS